MVADGLAQGQQRHRPALIANPGVAPFGHARNLRQTGDRSDESRREPAPTWAGFGIDVDIAAQTLT